MRRRSTSKASTSRSQSNGPCGPAFFGRKSDEHDDGARPARSPSPPRPGSTARAASCTPVPATSRPRRNTSEVDPQRRSAHQRQPSSFQCHELLRRHWDRHESAEHGRDAQPDRRDEANPTPETMYANARGGHNERKYRSRLARIVSHAVLGAEPAMTDTTPSDSGRRGRAGSTTEFRTAALWLPPAGEKSFDAR